MVKWSFWVKLPLLILVIISFIGSIYAAANHIEDITYSTPFIIGVILGLYFYGIYLEKRSIQKRIIGSIG